MEDNTERTETVEVEAQGGLGPVERLVRAEAEAQEAQRDFDQRCRDLMSGFDDWVGTQNLEWFRKGGRFTTENPEAYFFRPEEGDRILEVRPGRGAGSSRWLITEYDTSQQDQKMPGDERRTLAIDYGSRSISYVVRGHPKMDVIQRTLPGYNPRGSFEVSSAETGQDALLEGNKLLGTLTSSRVFGKLSPDNKEIVPFEQPAPQQTSP